MWFDILVSCATTASILIGAFWGILRGFYKTNREATQDYKEIEKSFNEKLEKQKKELEEHFKNESNDLKDALSKLGDKIDEMKTHYVTNENFKTYADAMNQLLNMSNERMGRIESSLDDLKDSFKDQMSNIIRTLSKD